MTGNGWRGEDSGGNSARIGDEGRAKETEVPGFL